MAISIIGHFGGERNFNDGQTIKTRTFYSALNKTKVAKVHKVDTYYIKKNPFLFIYQLLRTGASGSKSLSITMPLEEDWQMRRRIMNV